MSNMTVQTALAKPPSMPMELMAFVRQQLGGSPATNAQAFLQANTAKYRKAGDISVAQLDLTNMDADKARVVLNKLAKDTMAKMDMSRVECMSQQATQKHCNPLFLNISSNTGGLLIIFDKFSVVADGAHNHATCSSSRSWPLG